MRTDPLKARITTLAFGPFVEGVPVEGRPYEIFHTSASELQVRVQSAQGQGPRYFSIKVTEKI